MKKVKLTSVYHNATNRDGKQYTTKEGKPYERCSIKTEQYGDRYISGFGSKTTHEWNVGDEVEIIIEEKGEYLNFSLPKTSIQGFSSEDRERLMRIESMLLALVPKTNKVEYPEPDGDVPF